jgi:hypothetical protein
VRRHGIVQRFGSWRTSTPRRLEAAREHRRMLDSIGSPPPFTRCDIADEGLALALTHDVYEPAQSNQHGVFATSFFMIPAPLGSRRRPSRCIAGRQIGDLGNRWIKLHYRRQPDQLGILQGKRFNQRMELPRYIAILSNVAGHIEYGHSLFGNLPSCDDSCGWWIYKWPRLISVGCQGRTYSSNVGSGVLFDFARLFSRVRNSRFVNARVPPLSCGTR